MTVSGVLTSVVQDHVPQMERQTALQQSPLSPPQPAAQAATTRCPRKQESSRSKAVPAAPAPAAHEGPPADTGSTPITAPEAPLTRTVVPGPTVAFSRRQCSAVVPANRTPAASPWERRPRACARRAPRGPRAARRARPCASPAITNSPRRRPPAPATRTSFLPGSGRGTSVMRTTSGPPYLSNSAARTGPSLQS